MSPEHLQATASVDARADVWSLGVVLFECLTGKVPFEGNDFPQLCVSILTGTPLPLSRFLPDAPPALGAVIARCLEKPPEKRFQNIGALAEALAPFGFDDSARRVDHIRRVIDGSTSMPRAPYSGPRLSYSDGTARDALGVAAATAGAAGVVPPETTKTAMELRDSKPKRSRGAVVLAATALVAVGLGVTVLMLRAKTEAGALPSTGDTSGSHAFAAPAGSSAPQAPSSGVAASPGSAPSASVEPAAGTASPEASGAAPTPQVRGNPPAGGDVRPSPPTSAGRKSPAPRPPAPGSSAKRPAPAPTFDPGGVVNPFQ